MSFSSLVKDELCRIDTGKTCCIVSELAGVIGTGGIVRKGKENDGYICIVTENSAFARRAFLLIKKVCGIHPKVIARKNNKLKKHASYILVITPAMGAGKLLADLGLYKEGDQGLLPSYGLVLPDQTCCRRAFLRGVFLATGSVSDPKKTYHLEVTARTRNMALEICKLMASFDLKGKVIKRKGGYVVYLKEGENIVDFLNIIGAHSALLELENVRILKEMRNNINRLVNCETANLEKTVVASLRQINSIRYIKDVLGFDKLPRGLKEIAELRLLYTDASLRELGEMLDPPLGKSGVNHRLRKLDEIAERIRNGEKCR